MQHNNKGRRRKPPIPHFYSIALEIPGMSRPVACLVTAYSRREALRQARGMLSGIKVRIMAPGC
jgi:hypothetical protein